MYLHQIILFSRLFSSITLVLKSRLFSSLFALSAKSECQTYACHALALCSPKHCHHTAPMLVMLWQPVRLNIATSLAVPMLIMLWQSVRPNISAPYPIGLLRMKFVDMAKPKLGRETNALILRINGGDPLPLQWSCSLDTPSSAG